MTIVLGLSLSSGISAEVYKDKKARVQISIPDDWKVSGDEDNLEVYSPDETIFLMFHVSTAGNIDASIDEVDQALDQVLKNRKDGEPSKLKINGMNAIEIEGTGTVDDHPVEWSVSILEAKKPVLVISILGPGWKKWQNKLNAIAKSIKKY